MDSEKTWQTVHTCPQKSLGRGRPNSTMSAVTENTDILFEYAQLPRLPSAAVITTSSSERNSSNCLDRRNTIRLVSNSSKYLPEKLPCSNALQRSSSSVQRPVTRRGGSSPFFGGLPRTNSRAKRRRSAKVIEGYFFSDEIDTPSIAERDETNASLERSILSELNMDSSSMASRSNSRAYALRDVLGISYGGQTPDMVSKTRKSRIYVPGYKSPAEELRSNCRHFTTASSTVQAGKTVANKASSPTHLRDSDKQANRLPSNSEASTTIKRTTTLCVGTASLQRFNQEKHGRPNTYPAPSISLAHSLCAPAHPETVWTQSSTTRLKTLNYRQLLMLRVLTC